LKNCLEDLEGQMLKSRRRERKKIVSAKSDASNPHAIKGGKGCQDDSHVIVEGGV